MLRRWLVCLSVLCLLSFFSSLSVRADVLFSALTPPSSPPAGDPVASQGWVSSWYYNSYQGYWITSDADGNNAVLLDAGLAPSGGYLVVLNMYGGPDTQNYMDLGITSDGVNFYAPSDPADIAAGVAAMNANSVFGPMAGNGDFGPSFLFAPVPEPGTAGLLLSPVLLCLLRRRRSVGGRT